MNNIRFIHISTPGPVLGRVKRPAHDDPTGLAALQQNTVKLHTLCVHTTARLISLYGIKIGDTAD